MLRIFVSFCMVLIITSCRVPTNPDAKLAEDGSGSGVELDAGAIHKEILAINSVQGVEKLFASLENQAKTNKVASLYHATLAPLKELRGIAFKMRDVISASPLINSMGLSLLSRLSQNRLYMPPHLVAFIEYLSHPAPGVQKFSSISDMQNFAIGKVVPVLEKSIKTLEELSKTSFSFKFDRRILIGSGFIVSDRQYLKTVNNDMLKSLVAGMHRLVGTIYVNSAYELDEMVDFSNIIFDKFSRSYQRAKRYVFRYDPIRNSMPWVSAKDRFQALQQFKGKAFLTLRSQKSFGLGQNTKNNSRTAKAMTGNGALGRAYMQKAFSHFKSAANYAYDAMDNAILTAEKEGDTSHYLIDPRGALVDKTAKLGAFRTMKDLFNGKKTVLSDVSGKEFPIDVEALFKNAPRDLKSWYPNSFSGGNRTLPGANSQDFKWNYDYGRPTSWPQPTFGGFLPNKNYKDLVLTRATKCLSRFIPIPQDNLTGVKIFPTGLFSCGEE